MTKNKQRLSDLEAKILKEFAEKNAPYTHENIHSISTDLKKAYGEQYCRAALENLALKGLMEASGRGNDRSYKFHNEQGPITAKKALNDHERLAQIDRATFSASIALKELRIKGIKVFPNLSSFRFAEKGVTCLAGKNNSGKSTVLSTIHSLKKSLNFPLRDPNRDSEIESIDPDIFCDEIESTKKELELCVSTPLIALAQCADFVKSCALPIEKGRTPSNAKSWLTILELFERETLSISFEIEVDPFTKIYQVSLVKICGIEFLDLKANPGSFLVLIDGAKRLLPYSNAGTGLIKQTGIHYTRVSPPVVVKELFEILAAWISSISVVDPLRNIQMFIEMGVNKSKTNESLSNSTAILLNWRDEDRKKYGQVLDFLKKIDDSISDFSFPHNSGVAEAAIFQTTDINGPKVKLRHCGTGIAQMIGFAVAVLQHEEKKTILLDEPQAYLHPTAERALLNLIEGTPHQYIIATHSPVIINATKANLILLRKKNGASEGISTSAKDNIKDLHLIADELGTTVSAIISCAGVLWLEGDTEVGLIPLLKNHFPEVRKLMESIIPLPIPTGFVDGAGGPATSSLASAIYEYAGVPSAILIDREKRSAAAIEKLNRLFKKKLYFSSAHEVEDYLLDAEAIHEILCTERQARGITKKVPSVSAIESKINKLTIKKEQSSHILQKIFLDVLTCDYRKVNHGKALAEIILAKRPNLLSPYSKDLVTALKSMSL